MQRFQQRRAKGCIGPGNVDPFYLVSWKHHECQHDTEKEDGIEEEAHGCRASARRGKDAKEFIEDLVGFGVCAKEKH